MNVIVSDDVLQNPNEYVKNILSRDFMDIWQDDSVFHNIQPRPHDDEFAQFVLNIVNPGYEVVYNFVRKSPYLQEEPTFIHTDEIMGDLTAILYLSKDHPKEDGTTLYDFDGNKSCVFYSKFNRVLIFEAPTPHSRNIFENFGNDDTARLIQVVFLREAK